jgi:hypothetical protein
LLKTVCIHTSALRRHFISRLRVDATQDGAQVCADSPHLARSINSLGVTPCNEMKLLVPRGRLKPAITATKPPALMGLFRRWLGGVHGRFAWLTLRQ